VTTLSIQQTIHEVQEKIGQVPDPETRRTLDFQLKTGCRISEAVGKYAVRKEDLIITKWKEKEVALVQLHTAKHKGRPRILAYPTEKAQDIIALFERAKPQGKVFRYGEDKIQKDCQRFFKGIDYLIEPYGNRKETDRFGNSLKVTFKEEHDRQASTHALRHFRYTELRIIYGFSDTDTDIWFGWIPKNMGRRYAYEMWLNWSVYIDKLL